jgi:hypothetical protein
VPKLDKEVPKFIRPFIQHGVEVQWENVAEPVASCPFCSTESKFFISASTGMWNCKICGEKGNTRTFIRTVYDRSVMDPLVLLEVAAERKIHADQLTRWGLKQSFIDHEFILPGYGLGGKVDNLYRWMKVKGKRRMVSTATLDQTLFGLQFWNPAKPLAYICEGPWDGILWEQFMRGWKWAGDVLGRTADPSKSFWAHCNVVAVPGCETFALDWLSLFKNKKVHFLYDSDHPKKDRKGRPVHSAGYNGVMSAVAKLKGIASEVKAIVWGEDGYDPFLPDGTDIRDLLNEQRESTEGVEPDPTDSP